GDAKFSSSFYAIAGDDITEICNTLDDADYVSYKSHVNIRNAIGSYFSFDLRRKITEMLNQKSISALESKIFSQINELFFSPNYLDQHAEQVESTYKEIGSKLAELQNSVPKLASTIDHNAYFKVKHELEPLIDKKRGEIIENLATLPKQIQVWLALGAGSMAVMLFAFPLYSFVFPQHALGIWLVFLGLTLISVLFLLKFIKRKLNSLIEELEIFHEKLFSALSLFSKQIEDVAKDYKRTMIFKKNISVLQAILDEHNQTNLKKNDYITFLEKVKSQISDISGSLHLELNDIQFEGLIDDLSSPPLSNKVFTGLLSDNSTKKIEFRYPSHEPFEMDVSYDSLLKQIEFE
ncbi:MAG: hypothetical protein NTW16_00370, partial [Bacteroidetes bacterium]|nr:hypothetical protein [Bacteroidota bacterium]